MDLVDTLNSILKDAEKPYNALDKIYISHDQEYVRRTKNLRLIPFSDNRSGGKFSYAEWAHVIGIFQTLMFQNLTVKENNTVLDIGCGAGLLGIASEPFLGANGKYIGLDVMKKDIEFCSLHYPSDKYQFIHLDEKNPLYSPELKESKSIWPVKNESVDIATALSVWTHFKEEDALFYFKEVSRILKSGAKAIITFFIIDDVYESTVGSRTTEEGRFHKLPQDRWIFDQPSYGSDFWFHPKWANKIPEKAIGITENGLQILLNNSGMKLIERYQGNWKEVPGMFFQDILVFQKN